MEASATAAQAPGKQAAIAKLASAIERCPRAKAAYNKKYWPSPEEPLAENIARQLGKNGAAKSISIDGLEEVKTDGRLAEMLEMLPPVEIDEFFGRETLVWMWKEYRSRESRNRITEYLKGKHEIDIRLLERAYCAANTRALLALYELLQNARRLVSKLDVRTLVESTRKPGTGKRRGEYSLSFMETDLVTGKGWEMTWGVDTAYRIHLDAPVGIGLLYNGVPNAVSSAIPLDGQTLLIKQLQSLRPFDPKNPLQKKGGSRGLFGLDWKKLLVEANIELARFYGFSELAAQSAANNEWVVTEDRNQETHLKYEAALKIYDETAKRLGFSQGEDGNFYLQISKGTENAIMEMEKTV